MAVGIRKNCTTPSDAGALGPDGHGGALVLFLNDDTCMCFDGSPAGMSDEDYQAVSFEVAYEYCMFTTQYINLT